MWQYINYLLSKFGDEQCMIHNRTIECEQIHVQATEMHCIEMLNPPASIDVYVSHASIVYFSKIGDMPVVL